MSTIQVDRIIPYQSASVTIEGDIVQANAATTGSNTFVGDQNIQGTLTASIQEGYVLAGGAGDVSVLLATSSLGGDSFPYTGDAVISGSLTISGSSINDLTVDGRQVIKGTTSGAGAPQLAISSSDFNSLLTRNALSLRDPAGNGYPTALSKQGLTVYTEPGLGAELLLANFDAGFVDDVEFLARVTENGIVFSDYENGGGFAFQPFMSIKPNFGDFPAVEFNRNVQVTGSVNTTTDVTVGGNLNVTAGNINAKDILMDDPGANSSFLMNPDFFAEFKGTAQQWQEGNKKSYITLGEETAEILINGWSGSYDEALYMTVDGSGVSFKDWDGSYTPQTWLNIPQKLGNPSFKRTVEFEQVVQLAQLDPLPAGGVGQLAVSGSNLYFHNGSTWSQIN